MTSRKTRRWQPTYTGGTLVRPPSRTKTQRHRESVDSATNQLQRVSPQYQHSVDTLDKLLAELHTHLVSNDEYNVQNNTSQQQATSDKYDDLYRASEVVSEMMRTLEKLNSHMENVISFSPKWYTRPCGAQTESLW